MNKNRIQIILLSIAGGIAALGYIIKNVKSGETGAIIFVVAFLILMAYKPTRSIIAKLLTALVNLFSALADNADKTSNRGSGNSHEHFKPAPKNISSSFKPTKMNSPNAPTSKPSPSPTLYYFQCRYCYLLIKSKSSPISTKCSVQGRMHAWLRIAEYAGEGNNPYQCRYCNETIYAKKILANTQCSEPNRMHAWQRWNN